MAPESSEPGIDLERANAARMYDYYLGGAHNFAVDRDRADQVIEALPHVVFMAQANRAFLGRVVRWSVEHGVTQFLDLGSGIPAAGNVHEIAHQYEPAARVAYVDFEPVAVAYAGEIIAEQSLSTVTVTRADARDPDAVLAAPGVTGLLDFDRPVALLLVAVLPFIGGDITDLLERYRRALPPGSLVAVTHTSDDQDDSELAEQMRTGRDAYESSATPVFLRDRAQLLRALDGLELVPPGLVDLVEWPQGGPAERKSWVHAGVGLVR